MWCILTNECEGEPLRCPRFQQHHPDHVRWCLLREHSRTRARNFKKNAHKNINFVLYYMVHFYKWMRGWTPTVSHGSNDTIQSMRGGAYFENTRGHGTHKFKKPPTKMLTLCYVKGCISTNECEGEPLRCPTVPTTPSRPCEVVPTSRTLAYTGHIISKKTARKNVDFVLC